jgi:hypothetical protein
MITIIGVMMKADNLKLEIDESLKELALLEGWITGSLIETTRNQGSGAKPFYYLSRSVKGTNKITYISARQLDSIKARLVDGIRAKELFDRIADLTIKLEKDSK